MKNNCNMLNCSHSTNQILLICGVVLAVPVVDAVAYFYDTCYITVRNKCQHEELHFMVYQAIFLQRIAKMKQELSCSVCYVANFSPFCCYFPLLQHRLNDLEFFEPIAQILLYLTLKTNHHLNTALKQNVTVTLLLKHIVLLKILC